MDDQARALVRVRLERCKEDLGAAHLLMEHGKYRVAVNRVYYALFHLVSAALSTLGVERRKHAGVEAAFNQHLVKTGQVEPEYADIYRRARRWREEADYSVSARFSEESARDILTDGERFVVRLEEYLKSVDAL